MPIFHGMARSITRHEACRLGAVDKEINNQWRTVLCSKSVHKITRKFRRVVATVVHLSRARRIYVRE